MSERIATLVRLSDAGLTVADPRQDLRGLEVRDRDGEDVGKVDDLLVDTEERRVRFLRVTHGGILGFGATPSFVPVEAIDQVRDDVVRLDRDRDTVRGAPAYDPDLIEGDYYGQVYGYYGYVPPWLPGGVWGLGMPAPITPESRPEPEPERPEADRGSEDVGRSPGNRTR
jgi:sporulation protein YlmC with PRC-barrel domain